MTAHKKTLIRQAGSAEAFIDSLPLVVNCFKYSANLAVFQYVLTQNHGNGSPKTRKATDFGEFGGLAKRRDTWVIRGPRTLSRRKPRRFGEIKEWDKNRTLNAPLSSQTMKYPACDEFTQMVNQPEMRHCRSTILFRRNPPYGQIWSRIGSKHGDSCLGANRR